MASQIAHIVYAKKYFERLESGELFSHLSREEKESYPLGKMDRDEFILGCTFPDIRRIDDSIKRKDTHLKFEPLDLNFSGLAAFEAGWKFHLYCDMKRVEILNKYDFYSFPGTTDLAYLPAKLLEDQLLYGSYNNWEKIKSFFNNPPYIENSVGASPETFKLWYAILAKYMEREPDEKSVRAFLIKQLNLVGRVEEIMASIAKLKENKKAVEILKKVKDEIV